MDVRSTTNQGYKEYAFNNEVKTGLQNVYGSEGRKGNILNYVSLLPGNHLTRQGKTYAVLLPPQQKIAVSTNAPIPPPLVGQGDIERIQQMQAYASSLVGTQPQGYQRPMSVAEANTYAAISGVPSAQPYRDPYVFPISDAAPSRRNSKKRTAQYRNLVVMTNAPAAKRESFVKLKSTTDEFGFFVYAPVDTGYSLVHYVVSGLGKAYVNRTTVNLEGAVFEKKIFEDRKKVMLQDFPVQVYKKSIVAFYEDKTTGQMGLIKLPL